MQAIDRDRRDHFEERMFAAQKKGAEAVREYGECLLAIRNEKLYADDFDTFGAYLSAVWDLTEDTANKWITAYSVGENLQELGHCLEHLTISAAVALDKVDDPKTQAEVWSEARKVEMTPTARLIEQVAALHLPVYKLIEKMSADEEREFLQTAEKDIEAAANLARYLRWKQKRQSMVRAWRRLVEEFKSYRDRDPQASVMDQVTALVEGLREK